MLVADVDMVWISLRTLISSVRAIAEQQEIDGRDQRGLPTAYRLRSRIRGAGLVTLVLTLVELLRQLMERQALRRVDQGISATNRSNASAPH